MRALTGAIITAAALIGLGLTAQGIGTRYSNFHERKPADDEKSPLKNVPDLEKSQIRIGDLDGPMKLCLTILVASVVIGLGITFVGLMYHHHRRFHEHLRHHGHHRPAETASSHVTSG